MANVDGVWNMVITAPAGEQKGTLTVTASGDSFTGAFSGDGNSAEISDGKISGDTLTWSMKITKPMPLTLKAEVTLEGDSLVGKVTVATFGMNFPLKGTRA